MALSVLFMFVGVTFAADATTVNGYVADSKCGAKGKTLCERQRCATGSAGGKNSKCGLRGKGKSGLSGIR